jgi:acylglycerol lipase
MLRRSEDLSKHPPTISCPLLIQHGTQDKVTSYEAVRDFFAKLPPGNPDREFKGWDGYYHELHNEPEAERKESIRYIADWIIARSDAGQSKAKL